MKILPGDKDAFIALTSGTAGEFDSDYSKFADRLLPEVREKLTQQGGYFDQLAVAQADLSSTTAMLLEQGVSSNNEFHNVNSWKSLVNASPIMREYIITHPKLHEAAEDGDVIYESLDVSEEKTWDNPLYRKVYNNYIQPDGECRNYINYNKEEQELSLREKAYVVQAHNFIDKLLEKEDLDDLLADDIIYI